MPDIGALHPQVVHFVVALLYIGVIARIISVIPSLGKRFAFASPMALVLILIGTGAAVAAVKSGTDAHDKAEAIPGVRPAVMEHEDAGHYARNVFLVVAAVELVAFAGSRLGKAKLASGMLIASALGGAFGLAVVTRTADLGGDLVYDYAGGIGLRSGDPADVRHLLVAGVYNTLRLDRQNGNKEDAARRTEELVRLMPNDTSVKLLVIESVIKDRGQADSGRAMLLAFRTTYPNYRTRRVQRMLDSLPTGSAPSAPSGGAARDRRSPTPGRGR